MQLINANFNPRSITQNLPGRRGKLMTRLFPSELMFQNKIAQIVCVVILLSMQQAVTAMAADPVSFEKEIRPILKQYCTDCHAGEEVNGGLRLDSKKWTFKGGDSGTAIVARNHAKSELFKRITAADPKVRMPPEADALPADKIELVKRWIQEGANWTETEEDRQADFDPRYNHWAFITPVMPKIPEVKDKTWAQNPVDMFILSAIEKEGLTPNKLADKRTLIRRVTFDLTGLPPSFEEVEAFVKDTTPDAYERVVDRLLASPEYGERWGRHWLDVARYADTMGYNFTNDANYYFAWTYRDYVIKAFNEDKSYDQFLKEQLAADQFVPDDKSAQAALGFITVGGAFTGDAYGRTDDQIDVVSRGLMGLTLQCARCHNHKYDPLTAGDYYAMFGIFKSTDELADYRGAMSSISNLPIIAESNGTQSQKDEFKQKSTVLNEKLHQWHLDKVASLHAHVRERGTDYLKKSYNIESNPAGIRQSILGLLNRTKSKNKVIKGLEFDKITPEQTTALLDEVCQQITVDNVKNYIEGDERVEVGKIEKELGPLIASHPGAPIRAMAVSDRPNLFNPYIFLRGVDRNHGPSVERRFIELFDKSVGGDPYKTGSGRKELAESIVHPNNPLTSRVIVNRMWGWHFGTAIVRTPGDFGVRGENPTNPELLDYLALVLQQDGWSLKKMQRLLVTSATYCQASLPQEVALAKDPENRLWTHQNLRRLEFEAMRDSMLWITNTLDSEIGGRPGELFNKPYSHRRTVYGLIDRSKIEQEFRTFDFATIDTSCPQRPFTTVPQQTLFMLNDDFVSEEAKLIAAEVEKIKAPKDLIKFADEQRIRKLYRLILQRDPQMSELTKLAAYLKADRNDNSASDANMKTLSPWAKLAQALLMSNEYMFVD
jgi:hypothetical protein